MAAERIIDDTFVRRILETGPLTTEEFRPLKRWQKMDYVLMMDARVQRIGWEGLEAEMADPKERDALRRVVQCQIIDGTSNL